MFSERLINELGLLHLKSKHCTHNSSEVLADLQSAKTAQEQQDRLKEQATVKLDKSEFRLLVKMLQAIGHECQYEAIALDGDRVIYQHPIKTLVFDDINLTDNKKLMNLSRLSDLLTQEHLKRPVWEKLKTLKA